ncbi:MAG: hypothetical protein J6S13_07950 [Clostridia bacterium]|nr:hypothetical protein [Clostridia bacterium]
MKREKQSIKNDGGLYRGVKMSLRTADIIITVLVAVLVATVLIAGNI